MSNETEAVELHEFVKGYVECALWSSSIEEEFAARWAREKDEDPPAPDTSMWSFGFEPDDIAPDAWQAILADCRDFFDAKRSDLDEYCASERVTGTARITSYSACEQAGSDFWLTRNGHGAGFWDRDLGELGDRLTKAAKAYGSSDLYIGDDERIYVT